jgi:hypothetical protein
MSEWFYNSSPDAEGEFFEYRLDDEASCRVWVRPWKMVTHSSGKKPVPINGGELVDGFLIREVDPRAKTALQDYLEKKTKNPAS